MVEVSVVIPTYNRLTRLRRVIEAFERQTFPLESFEVIVVSDGSTDGSDAFLHSYSGPLRLTSVTKLNSGPADTRNLGVKRAAGTYILFIDDDVVPTPALIAEHMSLHATHEGNLIVLGPMLNPPDFRLSPWVQWEQSMLMKQYEAMGQRLWEPTARQFYTGNTSLRRQLLIASGGFDARFRRAEDVELAYRLVDLGVRFIYNPAAVGHHYAERSFRSWLETPYAYGRNDAIFARDKQQTWLLPRIRHEFHHDRNPLLKWLVRLCLDRNSLSGGVARALQSVASLCHNLGSHQISQLAYSGIFSLYYYQGLADELGGRDRFFAES